MQRAASRVRLRLGPSFHAHRVHRLAADAVGIGQFEPALEFRSRFQIEYAARKAIRNRVFEVLAAAVNLFSANSHQGERLSPGRFADRPELYSYLGIPIEISADFPLEAEVV